MSLFRRGEPLHVRLAREGGLSLENHPAQPSAWDVAGIHGAAKPRQWDVVVTLDAPEAEGERAHFVALAHDELVVEEGTKHVERLADAVERELEPPYQAEAVRRHGTLWAVAARAIDVIELPGVEGEEIELALREGAKTLLVDGQSEFGSIPALERPEHVARATRIDGESWQVRYDPL